VPLLIHSAGVLGSIVPSALRSREAMVNETVVALQNFRLLEQPVDAFGER
jgi:hypothetical protein